MTMTSQDRPESPRYAAARRLLASDPLALWRSIERSAMPPETADVLRDVLQTVHHLDRRWRAIQRGYERPAIDLAMAELHPARPLRGHLLDLAMTAILPHALEGSLAAAGVLVHGYIVALGQDEAAMRLALSWDLAPIYGVVPGMRPTRLGDLLDLPAAPKPPPTLARRSHLRLVVDNDRGVTGHVTGHAGEAESGGQS